MALFLKEQWIRDTVLNGKVKQGVTAQIIQVSQDADTVTSLQAVRGQVSDGNYHIETEFTTPCIKKLRTQEHCSNDLRDLKGGLVLITKAKLQYPDGAHKILLEIHGFDFIGSENCLAIGDPMDVILDSEVQKRLDLIRQGQIIVSSDAAEEVLQAKTKSMWMVMHLYRLAPMETKKNWEIEHDLTEYENDLEKLKLWHGGALERGYDDPWMRERIQILEDRKGFGSRTRQQQQQQKQATATELTKARSLEQNTVEEADHSRSDPTPEDVTEASNQRTSVESTTPAQQANQPQSQSPSPPQPQLQQQCAERSFTEAPAVSGPMAGSPAHRSSQRAPELGLSETQALMGPMGDDLNLDYEESLAERHGVFQETQAVSATNPVFPPGIQERLKKMLPPPLPAHKGASPVTNPSEGTQSVSVQPSVPAQVEAEGTAPEHPGAITPRMIVAQGKLGSPVDSVASQPVANISVEMSLDFDGIQQNEVQSMQSIDSFTSTPARAQQRRPVENAGIKTPEASKSSQNTAQRLMDDTPEPPALRELTPVRNTSSSVIFGLQNSQSKSAENLSIAKKSRSKSRSNEASQDKENTKQSQVSPEYTLAVSLDTVDENEGSRDKVSRPNTRHHLCDPTTESGSKKRTASLPHNSYPDEVGLYRGKNDDSGQQSEEDDDGDVDHQGSDQRPDEEEEESQEKSQEGYLGYFTKALSWLGVARTSAVSPSSKGGNRSRISPTTTTKDNVTDESEKPKNSNGGILSTPLLPLHATGRRLLAGMPLLSVGDTPCPLQKTPTAASSSAGGHSTGPEGQVPSTSEVANTTTTPRDTDKARLACSPPVLHNTSSTDADTQHIVLGEDDDDDPVDKSAAGNQGTQLPSGRPAVVPHQLQEQKPKPKKKKPMRTAADLNSDDDSEDLADEDSVDKDSEDYEPEVCDEEKSPSKKRKTVIEGNAPRLSSGHKRKTPADGWNDDDEKGTGDGRAAVPQPRRSKRISPGKRARRLAYLASLEKDQDRGDNDDHDDAQEQDENSDGDPQEQQQQDDVPGIRSKGVRAMAAVLEEEPNGVGKFDKGEDNVNESERSKLRLASRRELENLAKASATPEDFSDLVLDNFVWTYLNIMAQELHVVNDLSMRQMNLRATNRWQRQKQFIRGAGGKATSSRTLPTAANPELGTRTDLAALEEGSLVQDVDEIMTGLDLPTSGHDGL
eukprot:Clim_evm6s228 gene=Clim_evmTU6s228